MSLWDISTKEVYNFVDFANTFHPTNIKFTCEISSECTVFLDTEVFKGPRISTHKILNLQTHFKPTERLVFNIHTSHLATLQTAKRVKEKHYMYSCFIYRKNFIFRFSHFESHPKTVNIQGHFELQEPIRTHENCYPLIWWILILVKFMRQDL